MQPTVTAAIYKCYLAESLILEAIVDLRNNIKRNYGNLTHGMLHPSAFSDNINILAGHTVIC